MSDCPRMMTRDQIVEGLKAGRILRIDRRDAPELNDIRELEQQGLVGTRLVEVDEQYSFLRIWWKEFYDKEKEQ